MWKVIFLGPRALRPRRDLVTGGTPFGVVSACLAGVDEVDDTEEIDDAESGGVILAVGLFHCSAASVKLKAAEDS